MGGGGVRLTKGHDPKATAQGQLENIRIKVMAKDKSKKNKDVDTKPKGATPVEDDEFGGPGERSNFKLADHEGALLLITPKSLEEEVPSEDDKAIARAYLASVDPFKA
jgi:hypothetical protein